MGEEEAAPPTASNGKKDVYWVGAGPHSLGIVVVTAWMLSKPRQVKKHTSLHASCSWDSLVAHPNVLALWVPTWARALAIRVLDKLVQELQDRRRPIVFATFSGGLKSCLYQIFHILDESYEGVDPGLAKYRIVRDCYAGQIQDSSPVDFISSGGVNFVSHPTVLGTKRRIAAITWSAQAVANGLDFFLLPRFEGQRADMWNIAYKTGTWGPVLVLCSKDDELAPFEVIQDYSSRMSNLACKVTMIAWESSPHVGHLKTHPDEYISAVKGFLSDAVASFLLARTHESQDGSQLPHIDGTIRESVTSSSLLGGQNQVPEIQDQLSESLDSRSSGNGSVRVWIPARM